MAKKIAKKAKKAEGARTRPQGRRRPSGRSRRSSSLPRRPTATAAEGAHLEEAVGQGRQGARRREDPRLHARPVGPDLHPAAGLVRRRRDQGRAAGPRRHHARPAGQDVPGADSLYFTMLNHNKRSITLDSKSKEGMKVLERLVKTCDVLVENFAPGALDRMGLTWERIHSLEPAHDRRLGQGLRPRPLRGLQGLRERGAVRRRLGLDHRLPSTACRW